MKLACALFCLTIGLVPLLAQAQDEKEKAAAHQLFEDVNQIRVRSGLAALVWDEALEEAALKHTALMAKHSALSHQYEGEPDLPTRASAAGARFRKIAENVAMGPSVSSLMTQWMRSEPHRLNILDPELTATGIGVVKAGGSYFATEGFSFRVESLTEAQVEERVVEQLQKRGVTVNASFLPDARAACRLSSGLPQGSHAGFVMRWEGSDFSYLPAVLEKRIASRQYRSASVGSCTGEQKQAFASYRVAVLLYY